MICQSLKSTTKGFTINQAKTATTGSCNSLTYNGSAQTLVTASNAQGTVYYSTSTSLTSSNYTSSGSTNVPTGKNAGNYTVYYMCHVADTNNNTAGTNVGSAKSVTVSIAKATGTCTISMDGWTYGKANIEWKTNNYQ